MKMLLTSNKGSGNFPPLQSIINDQNLEEFAYDEEKCDLLNKYFSFISKLDEANAPLPDIELKTNNNITDLNVSVEDISDIIQILHPNKGIGTGCLLHKMKAYGITGNLIDWFSSYLKGRRQKVVIKNNSSACFEISAGVTQGSVLGPLLFIIYISVNDIADKLVSLSRLFADDTSFGYSNQDTMQLKNVLDHDLNEMDPPSS